MNTIYLVAYNDRGETMGQRYATGDQGIRAIVIEHYRMVFGARPGDITIAIDMEHLTAVVSTAKIATALRVTYRILRYSLDKSAR